jgi:hypothetical protein
VTPRTDAGIAVSAGSHVTRDTTRTRLPGSGTSVTQSTSTPIRPYNLTTSDCALAATSDGTPASYLEQSEHSGTRRLGAAEFE